MVYSTRGFVDTFDNQKGARNKFTAPDPGPYLATVKYTVDPLKMGRLGVNIPSLTFTNSPGIEQIVWCRYLSPFYGAKSNRAASESDPTSYQESIHSYGMWAVPPDIDSEVLVIFAKGESKESNAFWIGCIPKATINHMVPGYGASTNTFQSGSSARDGGASNPNQRPGANAARKFYATDFLPVGEKNPNSFLNGESLSNSDQWLLPINDLLVEQLETTGLINDKVRGTTSSSARRESPSQVFGISTPGPIREDTRILNIGVDGSEVRPDRDIGHSFVMDDGDVQGNNKQIRLRSASGHQILMNDTEGTVYIANGSGKAFIEMEQNGKINVYSDRGISIRAEGDFNLHSDSNINFHAKQKIRFTAEEDVILNAEQYVYTMGDSGILSASQSGSVRNYGRDGITSYTPGTQLHGAGGRFDLAGSQVHFNSVRASSTWGPGWLTPDDPKIDLTPTEGDIDIQAQEPLINGQPNKIAGKTTVMDSKTNRVEGAFVTHEPYDRIASKGREREGIDAFTNDSLLAIAKDNPSLITDDLKNFLVNNPNATGDLLGSEILKNDKLLNGKLKEIQTSLLKSTKLDAAVDTLNRIANTSIGNFANVNLNAGALTQLIQGSDNIKSRIKSEVTNAIFNKIGSFIKGFF